MRTWTLTRQCTWQCDGHSGTSLLSHHHTLIPLTHRFMPGTPIRINIGGAQEILDDGSDFEQNMIAEGARLNVQLDEDDYW